MFFQDFRRLRVFLWMLWLVMLVLWCGVFAYAQTPDLDLVTERSLGVSVSALEGADKVKVWCGIGFRRGCCRRSIIGSARR